MSATTISHNKAVSRAEWLKARREHLANEKAFTRQRDELSRQRRELPWLHVDKDYLFDGHAGKVSLSDLFEGRSQLIVYHFMFGPDWEHGCPSCSLIMDHADGAIPHLNARDVTLLAVSKAPLPKIEAFKARMAWKFGWVSSFANDFNRDYGVSFSKSEIERGDVFYNFANMGGTPVEELPGLSVFYKDADGEIYHTYSTYARGLDMLVGAYQFLDIAPKGRDEAGLGFSMAWVRHHDRYGADYVVDPKAQYAPPKGSICPNCAGA